MREAGDRESQDERDITQVTRSFRKHVFARVERTCRSPCLPVGGLTRFLTWTTVLPRACALQYRSSPSHTFPLRSDQPVISNEQLLPNLQRKFMRMNTNSHLRIRFFLQFFRRCIQVIQVVTMILCRLVYTQLYLYIFNDICCIWKIFF